MGVQLLPAPPEHIMYVEDYGIQVRAHTNFEVIWYVSFEPDKPLEFGRAKYYTLLRGSRPLTHCFPYRGASSDMELKLELCLYDNKGWPTCTTWPIHRRLIPLTTPVGNILATREKWLTDVR